MKTILCYGDSNTWGYDPERDGRLAWDQRWPGILQDKLGPGYRVIENGLCGRTTCHESKREPFVNGYPEARVCAEVNAPLSIAVVMLGTNDCKDRGRRKGGGQSVSGERSEDLDPVPRSDSRIRKKPIPG